MRRSIPDETWQQVKTAYAAGVGLREIARNMQIPEGTVLARAKREGWTGQILFAKREAQSVQSDAIAPFQSVAVTMQQRGERHVRRIADVTDKVLPHLESMPPAAVLKEIHDIEKFDKMARRNYGVSEDNNPRGCIDLRIVTMGPVAIEAREG